MRLMPRRAFLGASIAAALPASAVAQGRRAPHRIGYVAYFSPGSSLVVLRTALRELGYIEGRNLIIDVRAAGGHPERLSAIIQELMELKVDLILAASTATVLAAMRATATVPIVFVSVFDPVGSGIVTSLARPGGNVTGAAIGVEGLGEKWLQLLREVSPRISHVAVLVNKANPASVASLEQVQRAAYALNTRLLVLNADSPAGIERAIEAITGHRVQGLIVTNDPSFTPHAGRLVEFASRNRVAAIYFFDSFVDAGGLMAYGASQDASYRRAARYVDKILKGAKPGDLPVEQPTHFKLVLNLKAAKSLGLTVPDSVLVSADRIIE